MNRIPENFGDNSDNDVPDVNDFLADMAVKLARMQRWKMMREMVGPCVHGIAMTLNLGFDSEIDTDRSKEKVSDIPDGALIQYKLYATDSNEERLAVLRKASRKAMERLTDEYPDNMAKYASIRASTEEIEDGVQLNCQLQINDGVSLDDLLKVAGGDK